MATHARPMREILRKSSKSSSVFWRLQNTHTEFELSKKNSRDWRAFCRWLNTHAQFELSRKTSKEAPSTNGNIRSRWIRNLPKLCWKVDKWFYQNNLTITISYKVFRKKQFFNIRHILLNIFIYKSAQCYLPQLSFI